MKIEGKLGSDCPESANVLLQKHSGAGGIRGMQGSSRSSQRTPETDQVDEQGVSEDATAQSACAVGFSSCPNAVDDFAVLQKLLFPVDHGIEALYLRYIHGYAEVSGDGVLSLKKRAKVSFNSYFNSFYESYWQALSDIGSLFLEVECSGSLIVEVFRDRKDYGCHRIGFLNLESETRSIHRLPLAALQSALGECGRIFVDVTAVKKSSIYAIRFVTNQNKQRNPKITIGICTFNREKFLLRNLRSLLDEEGAKGCISKIIVVNQGPGFKNPELNDLIQRSDRLMLIEQGNLGGCGGFTRSMYEALQIGDATHHVLMDDDAVIDARVLSNLASLLSFTSGNQVIGGHMLDLLRPHFLYEAGAVVKSNTRLVSLHHNIDLRAFDSLIRFNRYDDNEVDYNAWWFCAIPIEQIRKVNLPAPIFIRGDDMEYGIRLQEAGVRTIAMPGIAVWHEPFYIKVGSWQVYYDLRNRLIMASTYPHRFRHEAPIDVLWWMLKAAASHDYMTCELLVRAVHDFLAGPAIFSRNADDIHAEISSIAKSLSQPSVPLSALPSPPVTLKTMPNSDLGLALLVLKRILQNLFAIKHGRTVLLLDHEANLSNIGPHAYVKTNGMRSYRLLYKPSRKKILRMVRISLGAWWSYVRYRDKAAKAWAGQIPSLRAPQSWRQIFDKDASRRINVMKGNPSSR